MRILLWDIDGTLLNSGGAGMRALARAVEFHPAAGEALARLRLDGMTDKRIARLLCAAAHHHRDPSIPVEEWVPRVADDEIERVLGDYLSHLGESLRSSDRYRILPGVLEALEALKGRAIHALGTGNVEDGARQKLEHGGLWKYFRFGGYGSDAEERADLIAAAKTKAEALLGRTCHPDEFVVIGDTPRDVAAAHANGFACVGVATGGFSVAELVAAHADDVLPSLEQPDALERIMAARFTPR